MAEGGSEPPPRKAGAPQARGSAGRHLAGPVALPRHPRGRDSPHAAFAGPEEKGGLGAAASCQCLRAAGQRERKWRKAGSGPAATGARAKPKRLRQHPAAARRQAGRAASERGPRARGAAHRFFSASEGGPGAGLAPQRPELPAGGAGGGGAREPPPPPVWRTLNRETATTRSRVVTPAAPPCLARHGCWKSASPHAAAAAPEGGGVGGSAWRRAGSPQAGA